MCIMMVSVSYVVRNSSIASYKMSTLLTPDSNPIILTSNSSVKALPTALTSALYITSMNAFAASSSVFTDALILVWYSLALFTPLASFLSTSLKSVDSFYLTVFSS